MIKQCNSIILSMFMTLLLTPAASAVELTHWPSEEAKRLTNLIETHANQNEFAVFDMDNTTYRNDLEEYLIAFLESKGLLTKDTLEPSLKLIPFLDNAGEPESLYSYYHRLCDMDDLICYPWAAQVFSGFTLRELKGFVDEALAQNKTLETKSFKNGKWVTGSVNPPQMMAGMQELFTKLQENGIRVYVMTAANEELVRMVASDPKYGYSVPPENVIGINQLLRDKKTGQLTTSRRQIQQGVYDQAKNMDLEMTSYLVNPMTWFEGKAGTILGWIDQWRKPILVGGDTVYSDTYMLLNSTDVDRGGLRLWVGRNPATYKKLEALLKSEVEKQRALGIPATADKNWVMVTQAQLSAPEKK